MPSRPASTCGARAPPADARTPSGAGSADAEGRSEPDRSALRPLTWNAIAAPVRLVAAMRCNDAMGAVAELAASQHGALNRRQAAALGLTARQIRSLVASSLLDEPTPGVLASAPRRRLVPTDDDCDARRRRLPRRLPGGGVPASTGRMPPATAGRSGRRSFVSPHPRYRRGSALGRSAATRRPRPRRGHTVHRSGPHGRRYCSVIGADRQAADRRFRSDAGASLNWLRLTAERLHRPGQSGTGAVLALLDRRQVGGRVTRQLVRATGRTLPAPCPDSRRGRVSTRCSTPAAG